MGDAIQRDVKWRATVAISPIRAPQPASESVAGSMETPRSSGARTVIADELERLRVDAIPSDEIMLYGTLYLLCVETRVNRTTWDVTGSELDVPASLNSPLLRWIGRARRLFP